MGIEATETDTQGVSTKVIAERNHVKPASVIKRLCLTGSYYGIRPDRLANGRLDWPDVPAVKRVAKKVALALEGQAGASDFVPEPTPRFSAAVAHGEAEQ